MSDQTAVLAGMMGHNSTPFSEAFDLDELPVVDGEVQETIVFEYEFIREEPLGVERGEISAVDDKEAARLLRIRYMLSELPPGARITEKKDELQDDRESMSIKLRHLLRTLVSHHSWLKGQGGQRADLSGLDLRNVNLARRNLAHADLNDVDLRNADLSNTVMVGVNLRGANLGGANLCGADLTGVDLTDANLSDAMLIGANLEGADLWRTNVNGCFIAPKKLHKALRCRLAKRTPAA
jgi:hypothetical protein